MSHQDWKPVTLGSKKKKSAGTKRTVQEESFVLVTPAFRSFFFFLERHTHTHTHTYFYAHTHTYAHKLYIFTHTHSHTHTHPTHTHISHLHITHTYTTDAHTHTTHTHTHDRSWNYGYDGWSEVESWRRRRRRSEWRRCRWVWRKESKKREWTKDVAEGVGETATWNPHHSKLREWKSCTCRTYSKYWEAVGIAVPDNLWQKRKGKVERKKKKKKKKSRLFAFLPHEKCIIVKDETSANICQILLPWRQSAVGFWTMMLFSRVLSPCHT